MRHIFSKYKLSQNIDISSIVFFRIVFGVLMFWEVIHFFRYNWIERYFIQPKFLFTYEGFHWIKPFPENTMYIFMYLLGLSAVLITLGLFYRIAIIFFFLGFTYMSLIDKTNYLNHFYLISLISFLLIFIPANRNVSLDIKLWPKIKTETVPKWMLLILIFQISIVYIFGGIAKINSDWLQGEPLRLWLSRRDHFPLIGHLLTKDFVAYLVSYSGLIIDLFIVPFLIWKPSRKYAFIVITMFHIINHFLWDIGVFPWFMIAATTLYFSPNWFRNTVKKMKLSFFTNDPSKAEKHTIQPKTMILLTVYLFFQIVIPLRHFIYPGDVSWNEKGHRFSWRMKLRDKNSLIQFFVEDLDKKEIIKIVNKNYLSQRQIDKMGSQPDMILQFAYYLKEVYKKKGVKNLKIRVDAYASLNGRTFQSIIYPDIDLLKINKKTPSIDWIAPLQPK